jgi:hypothetical protein
VTENTDIDKLFAFIMTYAQAWLAREPALVPFAAAMNEEHECVHLFADAEFRELRPLREVLTEGIRSATARDRLRAAALCNQAVLAPKGEHRFDAIVNFFAQHMIYDYELDGYLPLQRYPN